ncbi:unnamed protein product [Arctia plantaginis]|uniref:Uncharacterized protein n=1 Tax=Arctia plantaginis TaxID=874455 RepID=A0A8S0YLH3_ARCPL|nr:unnamed protein product [Arctia plantaginis]CAB3256732.1 unnamed protein product [Arctia plantaginis]
MIMSYEVFATFGISAILSFTLSMVLLLIVAAKRGVFRVGAGSKKVEYHNPLLVSAIPPLTPKIIEMTPLKEPTLEKVGGS